MKVPLKYIELIKDIYDGVVTSVKTSGEITSEFPITIYLQRKSALSLHGLHWNYCILAICSGGGPTFWHGLHWNHCILVISFGGGAIFNWHGPHGFHWIPCILVICSGYWLAYCTIKTKVHHNDLDFSFNSARGTPCSTLHGFFFAKGQSLTCCFLLFSTFKTWFFLAFLSLSSQKKKKLSHH